MRRAWVAILVVEIACASTHERPAETPAPAVQRPAEEPARPAPEAKKRAEAPRDEGAKVVPPPAPPQPQKPAKEEESRPSASGVERPSAEAPTPGAAAAEAGVAAGAEATRNAPPPPTKIAYDRILGAFSVDPELYLFLTPATCRRVGRAQLPERAIETLTRMAEAFARARAKRGEAAARLNLGALRWADGDGDGAYQEVMRAEALFAELGDLEGLAHSYEWLGWFFRESGAVALATDHLSIAYRMFTLSEDRASAERVLGYADSPPKRP
jgi:hypothetical protein